ncbi:dickkopf-related protein 3a [Chelmon rostratus]|uniref:dickkopf-related protein 3a n=1 Tax=Chelmon rostratus TaxID=109905 RepID=UPI001BE8AA2D|nr:dickkopf-related protein 3a [Chelmon rostratus]
MFLSIITTPFSEYSSRTGSRTSSSSSSSMMRVALLVLALTAVSNGILPEIVDSGISHILEDNSEQGQTELDRMFVEVEQLPEDPQQKPEDAFHQRNNGSVSVSPHPDDLPPSHHNETASPKVIDSESVHTSGDQETNNITTADQSSDLGNSIDHGCITEEDCGKGRYCLYDTHDSKCLPCKAIDVPCTKDGECCGDQLCVWGQCSQNATKGEAGSTCQYQTDCSPDLCCAFHKALLFPVCSAKPIERERCFGASNHLVELLSWDVQDEGPRKHCPCAGDLHCQHLGRGSMCLKGEDSSEEDLTDTLYSEIDYII